MTLKKKWYINIDWTKELQKLNIENKAVNGVSSFDCPLCSDAGNGKGYIVWATGEFKCFRESTHVCSGFDILARLGANKREIERAYKNPRRDLLVEKEVIEKTIRIWRECQDRDWAKPLLKALLDRCISKDMCEKYEIGFQLPYHRTKPYRISIPVKDSEGNYILQRLYLPGSKDHPKFLNYPKGNTSALFPIEQLKYEKIMICGGELKAILAAEILNQYNIGAICCTGGEGKNYATFAQDFAEKIIYVTFDVDKKGKEGEIKTCRALFQVAKQTFLAPLPEDLADDYPKGDINDFIKSGGDLLSVINSATEFKLPAIDLSYPTLREINQGRFTPLAEIVDGSLTGRIHSEGVLTSINTEHNTIPLRILPTCPRNQDTLCFVCPINQKRPGEDYAINEDRREVLRQIGEDDKVRDKLYKEMLNVPSKCPVFSYEVTQKTSACFGEMRLLNPESKTAVSAVVLNNIETGNMANPIEFKGYATSSPKNGVFTVVITEEIPSPHSLKYFELDEDHTLDELQPTEWTKQAVWDKLNARYMDLSHNVTRIYDAKGLHFTADLVFHSFRNFYFCGDLISGMLDVCVLGDTGQGKTKVCKSLLKHYGDLAAWVDSTATSVPGLTLGGDRKLGGFLLKYGTLPRMHNRMAIFEEIGDMNPEVFSKLKFIRSEGIAKVDKIFNAEAPANVRMLYLTNPSNGESVALNSFRQLTSIDNIFDGTSNVRRLDFVYIIHNDPNRNRFPVGVIENKLTSDICTSHLMWAWTQNEKTIKFEPEAIEAIISLEKEMSQKYSPEIPLVLAGDQKNKLARLSAACASLTFSTIVKLCHVEVIADFVQEHYDGDILCYKSFSEAERDKAEIKNKSDVIAKMKGKPLLINRVMDTWEFTGRDFAGWVEDRVVAQSILITLLTSNVVKKIKSKGDEKYKVTPNGIKVLQEISNLDRCPNHDKGN